MDIQFRQGRQEPPKFMQAIGKAAGEVVSRFSFNPDTAPVKMQPYILGNKECSVDQEQINSIKECFEKKQEIKGGYVFRGKNEKESYFFKRKRRCSDVELRIMPFANEMITPDSPAYRVRKSAKIEKWIQENGYENEIVVPKKYLFWDEANKEWYSVAEAIDLDENAVLSISEEVGNKMESAMNLCRIPIEGQLAKRKESGTQHKELSFRQATALAKLAFETGYTDQSYNNFFFDKKGRVAIIDTESLERGTNKLMRSFNVLVKIINVLFFDWQALKVTNALIATFKLKNICKSPEAKQAVIAVEKEYLLWKIAKTIGKIALCILIVKVIPIILTATAIPTVGILALKTVSLIANVNKIIQIASLIFSTGMLVYRLVKPKG